MHNNLFSKIISLDNLFASWREFRRGKRSRLDVQIFERNLEDNLFDLHHQLKNNNPKATLKVAFVVKGMEGKERE